MPDQYFLPVIHPSFELLKKSSRSLHFIAAAVILFNGLYFLQDQQSSKLMCWLQLVIAAEILLVISFANNLLKEVPGLGVFFRLAEAFTLVGIGFPLISTGHFFQGSTLLLASFGYIFLFYREWRMAHSESVNIRQTGVTLPNFTRDEEIGWPEIKSIVPGYHSIFIETFRRKTIRFRLRRNLKIEELQQIDEFCRRHLPPAK